jgi:hypothetical protein
MVSGLDAATVADNARQATLFANHALGIPDVAADRSLKRFATAFQLALRAGAARR